MVRRLRMRRTVGEAAAMVSKSRSARVASYSCWTLLAIGAAGLFPVISSVAFPSSCFLFIVLHGTCHAEG